MLVLLIIRNFLLIRICHITFILTQVMMKNFTFLNCFSDCLESDNCVKGIKGMTCMKMEGLRVREWDIKIIGLLYKLTIFLPLKLLETMINSTIGFN